MFLGINLPWKKTPSGDVLFGRAVRAPAFALLDMANGVILGENAKLKAAYNRGPTQPPRIVFLGDSNLAGAGAGTGTLGLVGARPKGFAFLIAKSFGWQTDTFYGDQNAAANGVTLGQFDPRITLGSFSSSATQTTSGGSLILCNGASSIDFKFTPESPCNKIVLKHPIASSGNTSVAVKVDGVVIDTFSQAGANAYTAKTYEVPLGMHAISIQAIGTGTAFIHGIEATNTESDKPIFVQLGWAGGIWGNLCMSGLPWNPLESLIACEPDALFTHCTINDITVGTAIATVVGNIATINNSISPTASILHTVSFPANLAGVTAGTLDLFASNLKFGALGLGGSFADARNVMSNAWTTANINGWCFDDKHPSESGHAREANYFAKLFK